MKALKINVLITGASSGLGRDVLHAIVDQLAPRDPRVKLWSTGRGPDTVLRYELSTKCEIELENFDFVIHFAWDRGDLSLTGKNVVGTSDLIKRSKQANCCFVFISTIEASKGFSQYAEQKRTCEKMTLENGGHVIRVGAITGGSDDFFARLRRGTHFGKIGICIKPDPVMYTTPLPRLVAHLSDLIVGGFVPGLFDLTEGKTQSLSELLAHDQVRARLPIPARMIQVCLRVLCHFYRPAAVWHDRFLALRS